MAYYDPDADISAWSDGSGGYADVDDGVRQPTDPGETDSMSNWAASDPATLSIEEISGAVTVTNIRVWVYGMDYGSSDNTQVDVSRDGGSTWEGYQTVALPHTSNPDNAEWKYVDFSVNWSGTTDFRLRINKAATSWNNSYYYAIYVESTESAGAAADLGYLASKIRQNRFEPLIRR